MVKSKANWRRFSLRRNGWAGSPSTNRSWGPLASEARRVGSPVGSRVWNARAISAFEGLIIDFRDTWDTYETAHNLIIITAHNSRASKSEKAKHNSVRPRCSLGALLVGGASLCRVSERIGQCYTPVRNWPPAAAMRPTTDEGYVTAKIQGVVFTERGKPENQLRKTIEAREGPNTTTLRVPSSRLNSGPCQSGHPPSTNPVQPPNRACCWAQKSPPVNALSFAKYLPNQSSNSEYN